MRITFTCNNTHGKVTMTTKDVTDDVIGLGFVQDSMQKLEIVQINLHGKLYNGSGSPRKRGNPAK